MSGSASRRARASQARGLSRKSNIIWARSLGPSGRLPTKRADLARRHVGLAQQHRVAAQPLRLLPPGVHDRKVLRAGIDAGLDLLEDERRGIDPEAGRTELQPEAHDLGHLGAYGRIGPVQVRLEVVEAMEVPGLRLLVEGPGLALLAREDRALATVRRLLGAPDVPVAVRRIRAAAGRDEPGMLIGGVVDHEVEDDPDAALLAPRRASSAKSPRLPSARIDAVVVADVVAVVTPGLGWIGFSHRQVTPSRDR